MSSSLTIDEIINFSLSNNCKYAALIDINTMFGTMEFYNKCKKHNLTPVIGVQYKDFVLIPKTNSGFKNLIKISSLIGTNATFNLKDYAADIYIINLKNEVNEELINTCARYFVAEQVAVKQNFMLNQSDEKYVHSVLAIKNANLLADYESDSSYHDSFLLTNDQAEKRYNKLQLENLEFIVSSIDITFNLEAQMDFVKYDKNKASNILLQRLCKEGLLTKIPTPNIAYIERLKYELEVIDKMGFNDYFLVVQDYVNFAKRSGMLVGPGRGSAAGSLVSYSLNITEIDPIKHNLLFERFLNPDRKTMPDIDVDFPDDRRNEVSEYLLNKYGVNSVAHIITFQRMKAKMAIRDAGRILNMNINIINNISKMFSMDYEEDIDGAINDMPFLKEAANSYPELFDISKKLIGFPRQSGLHAAGIVLTNKMDDVVPVINSTDGINSTQYSMEYLEPLGLIKVDLLGLSNLTIIQDIIKLIRSNKGEEVILDKLNLEDSKVYSQLASGDTIGIFQFESSGMTKTVRDVKPKTLEDLSVISALYRPGPQEYIPTYLKNKADPASIKYVSEDLKTILSSTFNIVVYQEQLMEIIKKVCNFSLAKADVFRRIISKKKIEMLPELEKEFIEAATNNNYKIEDARNIWSYVYSFASYGFNHSHSLAYSLISYWLAYLKYYFPCEFFTVLMSADPNKVSTYVLELKKHGIKVVPPSINNSDFGFTINSNQVIFGLLAIKGIGYETVNKILTIRQNIGKFKDFLQAFALLSKNGIGIKTAELLIKVGAFDELLNGKTKYYLLENLQEIYTKSKTTTTDGKFIIQPMLKQVEENSSVIADIEKEQEELLGVSFATSKVSTLLSSYAGEYKLIDLATATASPLVSHCLVKLTKFNEIKTKKGDAMAFADISDDSKTINHLSIFPGVYEKIKDLLKKDNYYIVTLKNDARGVTALGFKNI